MITEHVLAPFAQCHVCGECAAPLGFDPEREDLWRCTRHRHRNPCAIEGCKRSTAVPLQKVGEDGTMARRLADDQWFCGLHWRAFVPPGSQERRIYHRFFRLAKRRGWNERSIAAFHRFWKRLVSRARARAAGDINVREINKLMGWG